MALLEVVQAQLKDWRPPIFEDPGDYEASRIYLKVHCEAHRFRERFRCACARAKSKDDEQPEAFTVPLEEQREMLWERRTDDNFLMALFAFEERGRAKKLRRGEQVNLVAEAIRVPLGDEMEEEETVLQSRSVQILDEGDTIATFQGKVRLDIGELTLRHKSWELLGDDEEAIDEAPIPTLIFTLRPRSTRPFHLEYARPDGGTTPMSIYAPDALGRLPRHLGHKKVFEGLLDERVSEDRLDHSAWRTRARDDTGPLTPDFALDAGDHHHSRTQRGGAPCWPTPSDADGSVLERLSAGSADSSRDSFSHELTTPQCDLTTPQHSPSWAKGTFSKRSNPARRISSALDGIRRQVTAESAESQEKGGGRAPNASGIGFNIIIQSTDSRRNGSPKRHGSLKRGVSSFVGKIVSMRVTAYGEKRDEDVPVGYKRWVPSKIEWPETWKSPWPTDQDALPEGANVVALMEAEFRRDCIIFFNTIFPRTQGQSFRQLVDLSLTTSEYSNIPFKMLETTTSKARLRASILPAHHGDIQTPPSAEGRDKSSCQRWMAACTPHLFRIKREISVSKAASEGSASDGPVLVADGTRELEDSEACMTPSVIVWDPGHSAGRCDSTGLKYEPRLYDELGESTRRSVATVRSQRCFSFIASPKGTFVDEYSPRIMFLKRLFLCFATCGVYYNEASKRQKARELWPYPVASILGHGSRVLIRLEDVSPHEFINFLLSGEPRLVDWKDSGNPPYPVHSRPFATHAVSLEQDTGELAEIRLKTNSVKDGYTNLTDGFRKKHLGLDLPIGGVGNPSPMGEGLLVDFSGRVVQFVQEEGRKRSKFRPSNITTGRSPWGSEELNPRITYPPQIGVSEEQGEAASSAGESSGPVRSMSSANFMENNATVGSREREERPERPVPQPILARVSDPQLSNSRQSTPFSPHGAQLLVPNSQTPRASLEAPNPLREWTPVNSGQAYESSNMRTNAKVEPGVQGGHLYMHIDDHGPQRASNGTIVNRVKEDRRRCLREPPRDYVVPLEQAQLRARMQHQDHVAGEVFFSSAVPEIKVQQNQRLFENPAVHAAKGSGVRLMRMKSEPTIFRFQAPASREDFRWVKEMIVNNTPAVALRSPPSAAALRLFLEHYDPLHTQLLGKCGFGSVEKFFQEVKEHKVFLMKRGAGIIRYVEPVVLQLRYKGQILVQTHQLSRCPDGEDATLQKNSLFCTKMAPDERWQAVLKKGLKEKLDIDPSRLKNATTRSEESHNVMEETRRSPSYPGLMTYYRCHFVEWELTDSDPDLLRKLGLPISEKARAANPHGCDFETHWPRKDGESGASRKAWRTYSYYWRWIPEHTARQRLRFWNIGTKTADERWARYALQKDGVVQFPPTQNALLLLLSRCGVDAGFFAARQGRKSVEELWYELLSGESYLQMKDGYPLRVAETLFVRLRWRSRQSTRQTTASADPDDWYVLLKNVTELNFLRSWKLSDRRTEEELARDVAQSKQLPHTKKLPEENWKEAAIRCLMQDLQLTKQQVTVLTGLTESWVTSVTHVRSGTDHNNNGEPKHTSFDQIRTSSSYPGLRTLYRTHLVTFHVREDFMSLPDWRGLFGLTPEGASKLPILPRARLGNRRRNSDPTSGESLVGPRSSLWSALSSWTNRSVHTSRGSSLNRTHMRHKTRLTTRHQNANDRRNSEPPTPSRRNSIASRRGSYSSTPTSRDPSNTRDTASVARDGTSTEAAKSQIMTDSVTGGTGEIRMEEFEQHHTYTEGLGHRDDKDNILVNFQWIKENQAGPEVFGIRYWAEERKQRKKHHVSSVLIGLEGSAPKTRSPFGCEHDGKAVSNPLSAVGGRKWRAYRTNNALQIPSDEDGMHMNITREMFDELVQSCDDLGLMDPATDLISVGEGARAYKRDVLDQRYAEKELLKQILGGSGTQAMHVVEWMKEQLHYHKTPSRACAAMNRLRRAQERKVVDIPVPERTDSKKKMLERKESGISGYSLDSKLFPAEAANSAWSEGSAANLPQPAPLEASVNASTDPPWISI